MRLFFHHITKHYGRYGYLLAVFVLVFTIIALTGHLQATQHQLRVTSEALREAQAMVSDSCRARNPWTANTTRTFTLQSAGTQREYLAHLPASFSDTKHYPVVLIFAGRGGDAKAFSQQVDVSRWNAITVFPQALIGQGGATAWQGAPYSTDSNDIAFVDDILDTLESQLCIQRSHVFSAGFSNGGGFAWQLACTRSDRIAAAAMVAGAFYAQPRQDCTGERPAALLSIHGDHDEVVPYGGSVQRQLPNIDTWSAQQAERNGCKKTPVNQQYSTLTTVTTWVQCDDNASVQNIRLHGTNHTWPATLALPQAPNANTSSKTSTTIWRFFMNHPL